MLYRRAIYPALVRIGGGDPETAHERVLAALAFVSRSPTLTRALDIAMSLGQPDTSSLALEVFGAKLTQSLPSTVQSGLIEHVGKTSIRAGPKIA